MLDDLVDIRAYKASDIPQIVELCSKQIPLLPNYKGVVVDIDRISYVLRHNLSPSAGFQCWVLVTRGEKIVGVAAGYCNQGLITKEYIANDSFLCILPEYRNLKRANALISAYKEWALQRGATIVSASTRSGYRPEEFAVFMKRNGFEKIGEVYTLRKQPTAIEQELAKLKED